ncbi:MAG: hypothetical protein RH862_07725 [Leptospiraceae bacterium]
MRFVALLAWILFGFTFLLAARWPALARSLGGLSRLHRIHHILGLSTGALAVLHTLHQIWKDPEVAFYFEDPFLLLGWISLLLLVAGLGLSFLGRLHHRWWLLLHWSLAGAYLGALFHSYGFLQHGRWHEVAFLAGLGLGGLGLTLIFLYRWKGQNWVVQEVKNTGSGLFELILKPEIANANAPRAGSLIYLQFGSGFTSNWHPFSVASCRMSPELHVLIKNAGLDTSHLLDMKPGHVLRLQGPFAEFQVSQDPQLWVAAGTGLAPFLGMARCFDFTGAGTVELYFFEAKPEPIVEAELDRISQSHPEFRWKAHYGKSADFSEMVKSARSQQGQILICGSPGFMKKARMSLHAAQISGERIHTEESVPW